MNIKYTFFENILLFCAAIIIIFGTAITVIYMIKKILGLLYVGAC